MVRMITIQHTAQTCPGRPCSTECDHVEFASTVDSVPQTERHILHGVEIPVTTTDLF